jgi:transposase-like protein
MGSQREERLAQMRHLVDRWHESGESAVAFARANGMSPSTLFGWQRRLTERRGRARRAARLTLLPVRVTSTAADRDGAIDVLLASGDRIHISDDRSEERLRLVVRVLRTTC